MEGIRGFHSECWGHARTLQCRQRGHLATLSALAQWIGHIWWTTTTTKRKNKNKAFTLVWNSRISASGPQLHTLIATTDITNGLNNLLLIPTSHYNSQNTAALHTHSQGCKLAQKALGPAVNYRRAIMRSSRRAQLKHHVKIITRHQALHFGWKTNRKSLKKLRSRRGSQWEDMGESCCFALLMAYLQPQSLLAILPPPTVDNLLLYIYLHASTSDAVL